MYIVIDIDEKVNRNVAGDSAGDSARNTAHDAADYATKNTAHDAAGDSAGDAAKNTAHDAAGGSARNTAYDAADYATKNTAELCKLHVTDDISLADSLYEKGLFVVPVISEANSYQDLSKFKYLITNPEELDEDYYIKIWQRFAGLPWHILDTKRCIVREMTTSDVKELYDVYADPSITKYTEVLFPNYEDEYEYTKNYINNVYSYFGFGTWVIESRETGHIIGRAGFNYRPDYDEPELGYVIATPYQNQGYAYEVCSSIIQYMKDEFNIDRISAFSSEENVPSIHLLNKLGFEAQDESENIYMENIGGMNKNLPTENSAATTIHDSPIHSPIVLRRFLLKL